MKHRLFLILFHYAITISVAQTPPEKLNLKINSNQKPLVSIADYDEAIKANPKNTDYYISRARLKGNAADFKGAIADFTKAIELYPKATAAYFDRA